MKLLRFTTTLVGAILAATVLSPAARAQERIEVPWAELEQVFSGRIISTVLPDGTVLQGRVLNVSDDQLRFDANKTSNRARHPKGELSLPKNQLKVFTYTERKGHWRAVGTTIGLVAGGASAALMCGTGACGNGFANAGAILGIGVGLVGAGGTIGYLAGNGAEKYDVTVIVAK